MASDSVSSLKINFTLFVPNLKSTSIFSRCTVKGFSGSLALLVLQLRFPGFFTSLALPGLQLRLFFFYIIPIKK
ncbi:hypothetical protein RCL_jg9749.t1 [Rhizophagus clarus]|uniref:Uncharacterized protein n=1 Tax=Rhizophagus clarus TaxID=94130 RepID=A0A8H3M2E2_9GLOM|nr:hypothetical protein RCL_jg9749.t1 [Rhizophagus clarus]